MRQASPQPLIKEEHPMATHPALLALQAAVQRKDPELMSLLLGRYRENAAGALAPLIEVQGGEVPLWWSQSLSALTLPEFSQRSPLDLFNSSLDLSLSNRRQTLKTSRALGAPGLMTKDARTTKLLETAMSLGHMHNVLRDAESVNEAILALS